MRSHFLCQDDSLSCILQYAKLVRFQFNFSNLNRANQPVSNGPPSFVHCLIWSLLPTPLCQTQSVDCCKLVFLFLFERTTHNVGRPLKQYVRWWCQPATYYLKELQQPFTGLGKFGSINFISSLATPPCHSVSEAINKVTSYKKSYRQFIKRQSPKSTPDGFTQGGWAALIEICVYLCYWNIHTKLLHVLISGVLLITIRL